MIRIIIWFILLITVALGGGLYLGSGRSPGPTIVIHQPTDFIGRSATLEVTIDSTDGLLTSTTVAIEQNGVSYPLFSLTGQTETQITQETETRIRIKRLLTRDLYPDLAPGPASIVINAARSTLFGLRERDSTVRLDLEARFAPPRLSVASSFHYINHGGAELIVYRVTPPDAESGVRVGDRSFRGYPATATDINGADETLRVALFALLHDQELDAPIRLYARDGAGNEAETGFDHRVFPQRFRRSRIAISDSFLEQVVPEIISRSDDFETLPLPPDAGLLEQYLAINGGLRRLNATRIQALATRTADTKLWMEPFRQLADSQVESRFADHRTYVYNGRDIDQQVHLGFDLAVTANVPILAAASGRVVWADYLGIYGNCVIVDHGLGLQSLYAHLSSIRVQVGDTVGPDDELGQSGMTGLAGGDHLHFATLLHGWPIDPTEWWDPNWIEDRITRKLQAGN
ncbi:MAG: M23 family metallopeptidase [Acidobacteriota bacterium]|nr:M23 family metallopeptidase [Acidobacteriota bacterium]